MAVQTVEANLAPLYGTFVRARRRYWWERGLRTVTRSLCVSASFSLVAALLSGWQAPENVITVFWAIGALAVITGLLLALALRPSQAEATRAVDLRLGLREQLGTAEWLLARGGGGGLIPFQLAAASGLARNLPVAQAFSLLPRREALFALPLAAVAGIVMLLVSLGLVLPNPLSAIHLPALGRHASNALEELQGARREDAGSSSRSPALDSVRRTLDELRAQSRTKTLNPSAAAAALAQASGELNRVANESRSQQEALDSLANQLQGTAAGRDVAESLRQGNYDKAAQQLQDLGRQSDQLSASAKRQLSDALRNAASQSPQAPELAQSERQASKAFQQQDYSSLVQSMDQLAGAVKDSANRMVPQSELADTWQQLEQLGEQLGGAALQNAQGQELITPPVAQAPQATTERNAQLQQGMPGRPGGAAAVGAPERTAGNQPGGSGPPGNTPGGPALGNENPRLGPDGKPLDVQGTIGDRFPTDSPGSQPPSILREGSGNALSGGEDQSASGPLSVPAENVFVPGDRRPIVRDYFSKGSGGQ